MADRTSVRERGLDLLISAGLAASITAAGAFISEYIRDTHDDTLEGCRTAAAILQGNAATPYLDQRTHVALALSAARRLSRCLEE